MLASDTLLALSGSSLSSLAAGLAGATMAERLNGWKAIAGYFGRDRTTVMRWARERDLPVHRLPGGKIGGVFALTDELDSWRIRLDTPVEDPLEPPASETTPQPEADEPAPASRRPRPMAEAIARPALCAKHIAPAKPEGMRWIQGVLVALILALGAAWWLNDTNSFAFNSGKAARELPRSRELASLYVEARDQWAERTAGSLEASINKLRRITREEPGFAAGHAALAEALLLAGEFGSTPYDEAMREARVATNRALKLDPGLADAQRADGFIAYWWERQPDRARKAFERAIAAEGENAQTHFWFANILSDNGDHRRALAEFDRARLIEPGSVPIASDYAWALWCAGREKDARAILERQLARQETPVIHDSLSHIALSAGDYRNYADHFDAYARLRADADSTALARSVRAAVPEGRQAVLRVVYEDAMADVASGKAPDRVWAAFIASLRGDRSALLSILDAARRRKESWGGSGFTSRIAARWKDDKPIMTQLSALRAPSMAKP